MERKPIDTREPLIRAIVKEEIAALKKEAFVDGDAALHRAMQEANLRSNNFWREMWSSVLKTMAATGAGLILTFVFYSVLAAIKTEIKK
jgi:chaperone required for assembly of F1-ATPase